MLKTRTLCYLDRRNVYFFQPMVYSGFFAYAHDLS